MTTASSERLKRLEAFVPMPVAQAIHQQPFSITRPVAKRVSAVALFTDISGFTPLTELLSQAGSGSQGAEELTQIINRYFTRMIETIESYHGQVVKFSGDAITVLFPTTAPPIKQGSELLEGCTPKQIAVRLAGECALAMQAEMSHFANIKTSKGRAFLSMKVGIGCGEILSCSIGGALGRWEYVVAGDPVVQMAAAENMAQAEDTVLSAQCWQIAKHFFTGDVIPKSQGFAKLESVLEPLPSLPKNSLDWSQLDESEQEQAEEALQCYIPGAIKARLAQKAAWLAELRRMTILFVGVGGFDYESSNAINQLQNLVHATQEITYRFEGALGKVAVDDKGTILLIMFGAPPFSHEDDATRAITCALNLQMVAKEQNLRMSIGITEGTVFAGPVGASHRREYTIIGDEVNLAARLMQHGRGGWTTISERVKQRNKGNFLLESLGLINLKGKAQDIPAYRVTGQQGVQDEIVNRYLLEGEALIGQKAELEQIRRLAQRTKAGRSQLLLIEGELGLGKSRLAAEMVREWIIAGGVAYGSKCASYSQKVPYQSWREVLAGVLGLNPTLSNQQQIARLKKLLASLPPPSHNPEYWMDRMPLIADILGVNVSPTKFVKQLSNELRRDNSFMMVETILHREAERRPLLILLEDIHWADELSLELAIHIAQKLTDSPIFFTLVYRPTLSKKERKFLDQIKQLSYAHIIYLKPLSDQESSDLLRLMLGQKTLGKEVEKVLLKRAQGNPFFLQEIVGAIREATEDEEKKVFELVDALNLPHTVQDVILSRVDRLPEEEKLTLKLASVIGATFQRLLLSEIHPMNNAKIELHSQLERLVKDEKLLRLESPAPKWEYVFRNVLARDVVYEGLLLSQRRQLHGIVGETLEILAPKEIEQLAFHYSRSDHWQKAIKYLNLAAEKAQREYANQEAIDYYSEILTCLQQDAEEAGESFFLSSEYWNTVLKRAELYHLTGQREEEVEDLGTLGIMAEAMNNDDRRALAAKQWAYLYENSGDYDSGLEMIERSVQLAQKANNEILLGAAYNQGGRLLYLHGNYEKAQIYLQQAWDIALKEEDKTAQADSLTNRGIVAHYQANYQQAITHFEQAIELWKTVDNQTKLGNTLSHLGQVYYDVGQYMTSLKYHHEAMSLHQTIGDQVGQALIRHNLGKVYRSLGDYSRAEQLLQKSLTFYQMVEDRHREASSLYHLGFLYCRQKKYENALDFLEDALTILQEVKAPWWTQVKALIYYSWTLYEVEQVKKAKEYITETMEIERDTQQKVAMIEDMALMGRIALSLGEGDMAYICAQNVMKFIELQDMQGVEHPGMVYLSCYEILKDNNKLAEAQAILKQSDIHLTRQMTQIDDPDLRKSYLDEIPEHRTLRKLNQEEDRLTKV